MSWYRTYRPAQISDLHLTSVRDSLLRVTARGRVPQVWLFAGPKGTGKTSTARIMAAVVNTEANKASVLASFDQKTKQDAQLAPLQEPDYSQELVARIKRGQAMNVLELDAASNRGIDDVRQLKERIALPPTEGTVTVVILDEVHMFTTEAFNALLKVLEEPPQHAMIILATTELHKLPATITSRCFMVQFTKATISELVSALKMITAAEGISASDEALTLIAAQADGSFRDAVKISEQLTAEFGALTTEQVQAKLVGTLQAQLDQLVRAIVKKDEQQVVAIFDQWRTEALSSSLIEKMLLELLHNFVVRSVQQKQQDPLISDRVALFLLSELSSVVGQVVTPIPLLPLEIKCLELVFRAKDKKTSQSAVLSTKAAASVKADVEATDEAEMADIDDDPEASAAEILRDRAADNFEVPDPAVSAQLMDKWQDFIAGVKQRNSSLAAILGSAKPKVGDQGQALICVFYKFHQEQLQQPRFKKMIDESMSEVVGKLVPVEFVLETAPLESRDAGQPTETLTALVADVLV